jgi:hypothetical protein
MNFGPISAQAKCWLNRVSSIIDYILEIKMSEDLLGSLLSGRATDANPDTSTGSLEHLSDEVVLRLYSRVCRQVESDKRVGARFRLVGPATRLRAERLCEELQRRAVRFSPIVW